MIRGGNPKATECVWHRDIGSVGPAPTFTNYFSIVFYLTDVYPTSHTFSVLPDSARDLPLPGLDRDRNVDDDEQEQLKDYCADKLPQNPAAFELASPEQAEHVHKVRCVNDEHHRERRPSAFLPKRH